MTRLQDKYPTIPRLHIPTDANLENLYPQVEPYLSWTLVEIDSQNTDILIQKMRKDGRPSIELLMLCGILGQAWLRFHNPS